jgi:RNA polymerase sigma-70 factor, ECF subfamily
MAAAAPYAPGSARQDFAEQAGRLRRELLAHCYRMLGSPQDAEDVVQETYLRAWRSLDGFEGRSSLRTWLYRIATSACLRALENRGRRVLPSGTGGPSPDPAAPLEDPDGARPWIGPVPDGWLSADDPEAVFAAKESVRLALVAAMQRLPARQRAVLLLRDVVTLPAGEVAEILETSDAAVNSALQRARAQLARAAPTEDEMTEPPEPERRRLLDRYAAAWERADVTALTRLLRADVRLEMPPLPTWFAGRDAVAGFIGARALAGDGGIAMVPTRANGQPAFAVYRRAADGLLHAHAVQVLTLATGGVAEIVVFLDRALFALFDLPAIHHPDRAAPPHRPTPGTHDENEEP